ncbi:hypothetical protein BDZ91DRAFT_787462 [Kalaharituber pfeilii]|nr:hypothetical protein BDZ91DRAFT_787462 [Kalaharituber pfeilii]
MEPFTPEIRHQFELYIQSRDYTNRYRMEPQKLREIRIFCHDPEWPVSSTAENNVKTLAKNFFINEDGVLMRKANPPQNEYHREVITEDRAFDIIQDVHCNLLAHAGKTKTYWHINNHYYGINKDESRITEKSNRWLDKEVKEVRRLVKKILRMNSGATQEGTDQEVASALIKEDVITEDPKQRTLPRCPAGPLLDREVARREIEKAARPNVMSSKNLNQLKRELRAHQAQLETEARQERFELDKGKRETSIFGLKGPNYRMADLQINWELKFTLHFWKRLNLGKAA